MGLLKDLKMLDLSRLLPGPYCSLLLADLGMEVLKIEDPELECDWIEKTVTVNNYWYVIPTINLKLVKQIVPYIIQNINGI